MFVVIYSIRKPHRGKTPNSYTGGPVRNKKNSLGFWVGVPMEHEERVNYINLGLDLPWSTNGK